MSAMAPHGQVGHAPPKTGRFAAKPVDCAAGCAPPIANARTNEIESRRRMSIVFSPRATASYDVFSVVTRFARGPHGADFASWGGAGRRPRCDAGLSPRVVNVLDCSAETFQPAKTWTGAAIG